MLPVGASVISPVTNIPVPVEPFSVNENLRETQEKDLQLGVSSTEANQNNFMDFYLHHIEENISEQLNKLGSAIFTPGAATTLELKEDLTAMVEKFITNSERHLKFKKEVLQIMSEQMKNFESLAHHGGTLGYMEFNNTGRLLPIIKGWLMRDGDLECPILGAHHDYEKEQDIPLYGSDGKNPYKIGAEQTDAFGRSGKIVGLDFEKEKKKVVLKLQVGPFTEKAKPNYINSFELEYGARMNFVKRIQSATNSITGVLCGNYLELISMIREKALQPDAIEDILGKL